MDIQLPKQLQQASTPASKAELLNLKINQQLDVKVISAKAETQSLMLEISQSNKPIHVTSEPAIELKQGQTLQLVVTKLTPVAEFKIIAIDPEKTATPSQTKEAANPDRAKEVILKQTTPPPKLPLIETPSVKIQTKQLSAITPPLFNSPTTLIKAKILSITDKEIQLKLYTPPTTESAAYSKKAVQNILQQQNPIIKLKLAQFETAHTQAIQIKPAIQKTTTEVQTPASITIKQSATEALLSPPVLVKPLQQPATTKPTAEQSASFQLLPTTAEKKIAPLKNDIPLALTPNYKLGQTIQLEVSKSETNPEFKILEKPQINLIQGQIIKAHIVSTKGDQIQLALQLPDTKPKVLSNQLPQHSTSIKTPNIQNQVITLSAKQLTFPLEKQPSALTLKPNQQLSLKVLQTGDKPEFKVLENQQPKLNNGQIVTAKVVEIKNETIQLKIQNPSSNSTSTTPSQTKSNFAPVFITINTNQLKPASNTQNQTSTLETLPTTTLKPGQQIQLQVSKQSSQTSFTLVPNEPIANMDQKILETVKKALPIQSPPSEAVNQIIRSIPLLNKNEKIPDALKRIAREILDTIPHSKDLKDPKQLKQSITQSGVFLEAKLANKSNIDLQTDFKGQLLKIHQGLKQEVSAKTEQNIQSNELNLLKEMQQKTESSLARIILNQLTSMPKEEGQRQVWLVDLPFLHKDNAESVKIEINREHESENQQQENWSVDITVTPPEMATIHCKVSCFDKTISTRFWSDEQQVVNKISNNLDYLKTQFEKAGINPGQLSAHIGVPASETPQQLTNKSLFNQKV